MLANSPVLAVTPRNAFRIPLLQAAFPNASVRVIHLTRNPAAAVNGLRDGWLHHGFFSCRSDVPLSMEGYEGPWSGRWWCYDVPPGWRRWTQRSLVEVCAFQWRAAHVATLDAVAKLGLPYHRIAFEDVVGPAERRVPALQRLAAWLEVGGEALVAAGLGSLPVVMPTVPPRAGRWRDQASSLESVLADPDILEVAAALGYSEDPRDWA